MALNDDLRNIKQIAASAKEEIKSMLKGLDAQGIEAKKLTPEYQKQLEILKESNKEIQDIREKYKQNTDALISQEGRLKNLSGLQASIASTERARIGFQSTLGTEHQTLFDTLTSISDKNQELLALSREDVISRSLLTEEIRNMLDELQDVDGVNQGILNTMEEQFQIANGISSMSQKQQGFLNKQLGVYDGIKDTIGGILDTARLLTSTLGGAVGGVLIGLGIGLNKIMGVNKELGYSVDQLNAASTEAGLLSFFISDAGANLKTLQDEFGGTKNLSAGVQTDVALLSLYAGASGQQIAKLTGTFARLNGSSTAVAMDMIETTRQLAYQRGVAPGQVLQDMADAAEETATFSKGTGRNLMEAAVAARQLGISLQTAGGVANNLLDFESSITKELELSAMLGKSINLNRARGLAYAGKTTQAVQEAVKQLGGYNAFVAMDPIMRKQTADLLGVSVSELEKMANNQGRMSEETSYTQQAFDKISGLAKAVGNSIGDMVIAAGGFVMSLGQAYIQLKTLKALQNAPTTGGGLGNMIQSKSGKMFDINSPQGRMIATKGGTQALPQTSGPGNITQQTSNAGRNMSNILKGAAAMLIVAASLFVLGKALQEFSDIGKEQMIAAGVGLLGLVGSVALMGALLSGPQAAAVLVGAAAMLVVASSIYVLGKAIQEMATGFNMLSGIGENLSPLIGMIPGIIGLAAAFGALGVGLAALGTLGSVSIPVLLALGAVGGGIAALASSFGGSSEEEGGEDSLSYYQTTMLDRMGELINSVKNIDTDVYINGSLVTDNITKNQQASYKNLAGRGVVFGGS